MKKLFLFAVALCCAQLPMNVLAADYCQIGGQTFNDVNANKYVSFAGGTVKVTVVSSALRITLEDINYTGAEPLINVESSSYKMVQVSCYGDIVASTSSAAINSKSPVLLMANYSNEIDATVTLTSSNDIACVNVQSLSILPDSERPFYVAISNTGKGRAVQTSITTPGSNDLEKGTDLLLTVPAESSSAPYLGGAAFTLADGMIEENGATLNADYYYAVGGKEVKKLHFGTPVPYNTKVNGKKINSMNADDVLGDGKLRYDDEEKTLYYQDGAECGVIYVESGDLTIAAEETGNTLTARLNWEGSAVIIKNGKLTFRGGVVSISGRRGTENYQAMYGYGQSTLSIEEGADVTITLMDLGGENPDEPYSSSGAVKGFTAFEMPEGYMIDGGEWSDAKYGFVTTDNKFANPVHIYPTATAIENNANVNANVNKRIVDGQLLILREGTRYNAQGAVIK